MIHRVIANTAMTKSKEQKMVRAARLNQVIAVQKFNKNVGNWSTVYVAQCNSTRFKPFLAFNTLGMIFPHKVSKPKNKCMSSIEFRNIILQTS